MYCLSVSHKTSNVVVRKKLAFPDEQKKTFLDDLYYSENISECLILCTCNRTEVYFCGDESSVKTVETVLSDFSGIDFDELKKYICLFYGDRALLHLFRVAGGIDSMVIGEDEILGQLKRAYAFAKDNGTVAYELNMCVQAAVACAKKIKTETAISKTSVSVAPSRSLSQNLRSMIFTFKALISSQIFGATTVMSGENGVSFSIFLSATVPPPTTSIFLFSMSI